MDEEKQLLRQQFEQMTMNLAERDATLAERDAALTAERALRTAEVARAKAMDRDAALASWVAAERSLEVLAGASTDRDAEHMTAEYLAVALAEDYLAAERALRVSPASSAKASAKYWAVVYSASRSVDDPANISSDLSAATHDAKGSSRSIALALATSAVLDALSAVNIASRSAKFIDICPSCCRSWCGRRLRRYTSRWRRRLVLHLKAPRRLRLLGCVTDNTPLSR